MIVDASFSHSETLVSQTNALRASCSVRGHPGGSDMEAEGTSLEQKLNALVDGELDAGGRAQLFAPCTYDGALIGEIHHLRRLKRLVRLAYDEIAASKRGL